MFKKEKLYVVLLFVVLLFMSSFIVACGNDKSKQLIDVDKGPLNLSVYLSGVNQETFDKDYEAPLKKKYPNITLSFLDTKISLAELLASGTSIDLILSGGNTVESYFMDTKLGYDHKDLIKKYDYDLDQVPAGAIKFQQQITGGPLYGLPRHTTLPKLVYNRDLFDKFGESYPKKGITWDEAYDLAKRMTLVSDSVQYQGMIINLAVAQRSALGVGLVDPKTNKSLFVSDERWGKVVSNLVRFHQITGNESTASTAFSKGTAAMWATNNGLTNMMTYENVRLDATQFPTFSELPGYVNGISGNVFGVSGISNYKDESFQVLAFWLSKEALLPQVRDSLLEPLTMDPDIWKEFGQGNPRVLEEKMTLDFFPDKIADLPIVTSYDSVAYSALNTQMLSYIKGEVPDINTLLRQAAEGADKAIEVEMNK